MNSNQHMMKVYDNVAWVHGTSSSLARRYGNEPFAKGLVEHSEYCECVPVLDGPPFM